MIEWLQVAKYLDNTAQEILANQQRILSQLNEIQRRVEHLGARLDENVLVGARSGLRHLIDGMNAQTEAVCNDEYRFARAEFNKLINLNPEETTEGTSGKVANNLLIGLGYWGNFQYFLLRGEKHNALVQVYADRSGNGAY